MSKKKKKGEALKINASFDDVMKLLSNPATPDFIKTKILLEQKLKTLVCHIHNEHLRYFSISDNLVVDTTACCKGFSDIVDEEILAIRPKRVH